MNPLIETSRRSGFSIDDGMIPLINIVFLMLIFFMVAGKISQQDAAVFDAPVSGSQAPLVETDREILMAASGEVWINGEPLMVGFSDWLQANMADQESVDDQLWILKVDAGIEAQELDRLLVPLRESGIRRLSLTVRRSE